MLFKRLSLLVNLLILAVIIGVPYMILWGWLLLTGRIGFGVLAVVSVLLLIDAVLMVWFLRGLVRPLKEAGTTLNQVAQGDFTVFVANPYGHDMGRMISDVNQSIDATRETMRTMLYQGVQVATASFDSVGGSAKVVLNAEEEGRHSARITSATERIIDGAHRTAENALQAQAEIGTVNDSVKEGSTVVGDNLETMTTLSERVRQAAGNVDQLAESSQRIGEITAMIHDIAEQTNLLALNAAIEAARAGEHGRGFSVVAEEVRSLASRTGHATQEINSTIQVIQSQIREVHGAMEAGVHGAEAAHQATQRTQTAFATIHDGVGKVTGLIQLIANDAKAESDDVDAITDSIRNLSNLSQANIHQAKQAMGSLEQANQVISAMLKELDHYEIPHKDLLLAQSDHVLWKKRLTEMLVGSSDLRPDEVIDHEQCRFGRWYAREGAEHYGSIAEYSALAEPHRRFHELARRVAELHQKGQGMEAQRTFDELEEPTHEILHLLDSLYQSAVAAD
jgi:methyl-accepting chemotaxis protein